MRSGQGKFSSLGSDPETYPLGGIYLPQKSGPPRFTAGLYLVSVLAD